MGRVGFGSAGAMRQRLTALVLAGAKTATATILAEFEVLGEAVPRVGDRNDVVDDDGRTVAVMETTRVAVVPLRDVTWEFARDEGDGSTDVADWREKHERYWTAETVPRLREHFADPEWELDDATLIVMEWFRLVGR